MNFLQSLTAFCCAPTQKNRREEEKIMRGSLSIHGNTSVKINKDGTREVDIKDVQMDYVHLLIGQYVTIRIKDSPFSPVNKQFEFDLSSKT